MKCKEIEEENLYDFITNKNKLDEQTYQAVQKHLGSCDLCQDELDTFKDTISLLNKWNPPELSPDFEKRVMRKIAVEKLKRTVLNIIDKLFRPFYIKLPLEGLAIAAVILLIMTTYNGFIPDEMDKGKQFQKGFEIQLSEVKHPIVIEVKDTNEALVLLRELIQAHKGKMLQAIWIDKGVRITFSMEKEEENTLFNNLNALGRVQMKPDGYQDDYGNIVVILKEDQK